MRKLMYNKAVVVQKSLQKFTDQDSFLEEVLAADPITIEQLDKLSRRRQAKFREFASVLLTELQGDEFDLFLEKITGVLPQETKNELWQRNHYNIQAAMDTVLKDSGRMPCVVEISHETGLSRQTVHKHLKEYATNPLYLEEAKQFRLMTSKLLGSMFRLAARGDTKAARLFFDVVRNLNGGNNNTLIRNQQNNVIQINNTEIDEDIVDQLSTDQLIKIERIIKTAVAKQ